MSNQRRFIQEDRPTVPQEIVSAENSDESILDNAIDRIENALGESMQEGDVFVISGANSQPFPVASSTVREVRRMLQHIMNIGPNATALVNGTPVTPDHILRQDDTLEFTKEGGEKGVW
jgi:hypothetical protein